MKYFVVSDIHGFYDEFIEAITKAGFDENNNEHILISCGDACDRGPKSDYVLRFFDKLYNENRAILIRGNHEDLMEDAIIRKCLRGHDIHNGTTKTVCQLTGLEDPDEAIRAMVDNELWNTYVSRCIDYYEVGDYIFVHGWVPINYEVSKNKLWDKLPEIYKPLEMVYNPNWREASESEWLDARWANGMKLWNNSIRVPDKTVVCGHYHASWGNANLHNDGVEFLSTIETYYTDPDTGRQEPHENHKPFIDDGIMAIDACTAHSHFVNCVVIEV